MNPQIFLFNCHPFTWAWSLLACAWVILSLPFRSDWRGKSILAWGLVFSGAFMLTAGLACRVLIAQRAPVTNMYESILWTALGTLLFGIIFCAFGRSSSVIRCVLPVVIGLLILTNVPLFDPALRPLPPILRSSFWLMTHVTTITLSYAAFALAMAVGHWVVWQRWRGNPETMAHIVNRALRIGIGLLATGTILGGIWAQSAWGRFWGWDPKETWALITLLIYLGLLHGRISGRWGDFGLAVGSILAFQAILMVWFGVNCLLGRGLHSYGFSAGGFGYVLGFAIADLLFVSVACASIQRGK